MILNLWLNRRKYSWFGQHKLHNTSIMHQSLKRDLLRCQMHFTGLPKFCVDNKKYMTPSSITVTARSHNETNKLRADPLFDELLRSIYDLLFPFYAESSMIQVYYTGLLCLYSRGSHYSLQ